MFRAELAGRDACLAVYGAELTNRDPLIETLKHQLAGLRGHRTLRIHRDEPSGQQQRHCGPGNVKVSLDSLMSVPWVRERVQEGVLKLAGLYFDIQEGTLYLHISRTDSFQVLGAGTAADTPAPS